MQSLATILDLLRPVLDPAFPRPVLQASHRIAAALPPVAKGGIEFDLLRPLRSVDILQCFDVDDDGVAGLRTHIARSRPGPGRTWDILSDLTERLLCPSEPWHAAVGSLWFEIDAHRFVPGAWEPSVFLEFRRDASLEPDDLMAALAALRLDGPVAKASALRTILEALEGNAHVSHLGAMLARPGTPLRINVKRLRSAAMETLLARLGIAATAVPLAETFERAYRTTLCLDVTDRLLPRAGAELSFSSLPARESGWQALAAAAAPGPLDPTAWAAFENWRADIVPQGRATTWPDTMILAELVRGGAERQILEAIPSHVKVTAESGRIISVKGYAGFQPRWRPDVRIGVPPRMSSGTDINQAMRDAISAGLDALLRDRCQSGLWRDFDFVRLHSDEWLSGYVGVQILATGAVQARDAAQQAWEILRCRRPSGAGWGYQRTTPPDADSTAWVLALGTALGDKTSPHINGARAFLAAHRGQEGFRTYDRAALGRLRLSLPDSPAHALWHSGQAEISASAALAGMRCAADDLVAAQRSDGAWSGFWMEGDDYATGLAAEALALHRPAGSADALDRAVRWATDALPRQHNVFRLAWLIRAVLTASPQRAAHPLRDAAVALMSAQRTDGSWPSCCTMRVPIQRNKTGAPIMETYPDHHGTFTSATIVGTLARLLSADARGYNVDS